jgi:predicted NAD/FAD-binding protein
VTKIGIIGTGIAGCGAAYHLRDLGEITLLEQDFRPGGHTNTVCVQEEGREVPIDTGFIVFNHATYPLLCRLFDELAIPCKPAEMSFSVTHLPRDLEYNGMGFNKVFAQRRNLFRPSFHKFLREILRFFRESNDCLKDPACREWSLRELCERKNFGRDFQELYLIPMGSAVWSTEPGRMLDFPARSFLRFFQNHGFLGVDTHHRWFTVDGGARVYLSRMLDAIGGLRLNCKVVQIRRRHDGVEVIAANGERLVFDRVIIAAHADQALSMLAEPTPLQSSLLSCFSYQKNQAVLHTDPGIMPSRRRAWASWNYRVEERNEALVSTTHYWMNALQGVSRNTDYFLSLNSTERVDPSRVLYQTEYEHPVFTLSALKAQKQLPWLNHQDPDQRLYFCGSYFRYGFHEDAYGSGIAAAASLAAHLRGSSSPADPAVPWLVPDPAILPLHSVLQGGGHAPSITL